MSRYAESTQVSADRSRAEIERTLQRYGADAFMYGWEGTQAVIQFRAHDRLIRFLLQLPAVDAHEFTRTPTGKAREQPAAYKAWEQACRQRWRALALVVKAKLEPVTAGENARRAPGAPYWVKARQTHCKRGHPFDEANTAIHNGRRECRACAAQRERERRAERAQPAGERS